jgi:hypothetical protein
MHWWPYNLFRYAHVQEELSLVRKSSLALHTSSHFKSMGNCPIIIMVLKSWIGIKEVGLTLRQEWYLFPVTSPTLNNIFPTWGELDRPPFWFWTICVWSVNRAIPKALRCINALHIVLFSLFFFYSYRTHWIKTLSFKFCIPSTRLITKNIWEKKKVLPIDPILKPGVSWNI